MDNNLIISLDGKVLVGVKDKSIKSVIVPDGVIEIAGGAFADCKELINIILPKSLRKISTYIDYEHNIDDISGAFAHCTSLQSIAIPNGVTEIGENAFGGTEWLEKQPKGLVVINDILYSCTNKDLSSIDVPNSVTKIGDDAFEGCTSLKSVDIPNSVTEIGSRAFEGCISLTSIDIPNSVAKIGGRAFYGCTSLASIDIPNSVTSMGECIFSGCSSLVSINVPSKILILKSYEVANFDHSFHLEGVFSHCPSIQQIDIPNGVLKIENYTFSECYSLKTVNISNSVKEIGALAFWNCISLEEINIATDNLFYYVKEGALYERLNENESKLLFVIPARLRGKKEFIVDNKVRIIGKYAFSHSHKTSLEGIKILVLEGITRIESDAFSDYYESIKEIHCRAKEDIEKMDISETAFTDPYFHNEFYDNCVLYVPSGTRWSYRHHPVWGKFKNIEIEKL